MNSRRSQSDFDAEIEAHIKNEADCLMAEGMPPEEALATARRKFGNQAKAKEHFYESNRWLWWEQICQDARYAVRSWRKNPGLTAIVILSLGIGIGANTAIFSVVNTLLLRELPYKDANRLIYVGEFWPKEPIVPGPPSQDFSNWRTNSKLIESIAAYGGGGDLSLTGNGEPERIRGTMVTDKLLDMIGATLPLGRNFTAEEDRPGGTPVVILGHSLWQRRFGGSPTVIGQSIALNGESRTIVGVLPAEFRFPDNNFREELLIPMALPANVSWRDERYFRLLRVLVKAKPGVAPEAIKQEFTALIRAAASQEPPQAVTMRKGMEVSATLLRSWLTSSVRNMILILEGVVGLVLFIACLNVASLQVARSLARKKEMALRTAIGAGSARLLRQLLTENLLLSLLAGGVGIALACSSLGVLRKFLPPNLRLADLVTLDGNVLLFTLAITIATGLLTGLLPALSATRIQVNEMINEDSSRTSNSRRQQQIHGSLVIAEVAIAMVLLIGSGLLVRTFTRLASANPGFDPQGILTLRIAPSPRKYAQPEAKTALYQQILEQARNIPGVRLAAIGGGLPLVGAFGAAGIGFQDRPEPPMAHALQFQQPSSAQTISKL